MITLEQAETFLMASEDVKVGVPTRADFELAVAIHIARTLEKLVADARVAQRPLS